MILWSLLLTSLCVACGEERASPTAQAPHGAEGARDPGAVRVSPVPLVYLDLVRHAERAHVQHGGPYVEPGGPGWARVTQLADRGPWIPASPVEGKAQAWLESIGATLYVPVGVEGPQLRTLELWLRPIAKGQAVSLFLDEVPLTTLHLKQGLHRYRIPLPEGGLEPGEHSIRFWFRFMRWKGKTRLSAALGPVRLLGEGSPPALPTRWVTPAQPATEAEAEIPGQLHAGPPTGWYYHLIPPKEGRLFTQVHTRSGPPVRYLVQVEQDNQPLKVLADEIVAAGQTVDLDVHLEDFAGQPIRLGLVTQPAPEEEAQPEAQGTGAPAQGAQTAQGGAEVAHEQGFGRASWVAPQILRPGLARGELPTIKNIVVFAIDGLRADRVGLGRAGQRAPTPNLDLIAARGVSVVDLWSGGAGAAEGHRRLLAPAEGEPSVPELLAQRGLRTRLFSTHTVLDPQLVGQFHAHTDLQAAGEPTETSIMMREVDAWLDVRKRQPFFLYLAARDPQILLDARGRSGRQAQQAAVLPAGIERALRQESLEGAYDAAVSVADYWVGQLVALLQEHGQLDETVLVVVGSVGAQLKSDTQGLSPDLLHVPLVIWHPLMKPAGANQGPTYGGDLADLGATLLAFAGQPTPPQWPGQELATALFNGLPLPPHASHARQGNQVAARFGTWLMRGVGGRDLRLWDLAEDPFAAKEISAAYPIALRALRDSMLDTP